MTAPYYDALDDFAGPGGWDQGARLLGLTSICLADGLEADKLGAYGIWGGLDPDERARLGVRS